MIPCKFQINIDFKIAKWNRNLPQVQPFYAVKCNPDPNVLKVLYWPQVTIKMASFDHM